MRTFEFLDPEDLVVGKIYGRTGYGHNGTPIKPVYIVKIFKAADYRKVTTDLPRTLQIATTPWPPRADATCVLHVDLRSPTSPYEAVILDTNRDHVGYIEPSRKILEDLEDFLKRAAVLTQIAKVVKKTIADGFPTILDALVRVTGQADLKKKIEEEPQLVKLFERIDEALS
jgi:hypothetical protein